MSFPFRHHRYLRGVLMLGRGVPVWGSSLAMRQTALNPFHKLRVRSG
jgi:hypothetical protein